MMLKINLRLLVWTVLLVGTGQKVAAQTIMVWPGDASNNGVVNNVDFLRLGMAYGFFGPPRNQPNVQWVPQAATPWNLQFGDGLNMAYADCNGDGFVNYNYDAFPIYVHYGNTHPPVSPDVFTAGMSGIDPQLAFDASGADSVTIGSPVTVPILLGSQAIPVEDLYGIVFSIETDSSGFGLDLNDLQVNLSEPSWANPDGDRITSVYPVSSNRLDLAWVRTDHNERDGFGRIGRVEFIVIGDVVGQYSTFQLRFTDIKMIDKFGNETVVAGDSLTVTVLPDPLANSPGPNSGAALKIWPNPVKDRVNVRAGVPIETITLYNLLGEAILTVFPDDSRHELALPPALPGGVYLLEIRTRTGVWVRKVRVE